MGTSLSRGRAVAPIVIGLVLAVWFIWLFAAALHLPQAHELPVALDEEHEILRHQSCRRVERVQRGIECGIAVPLGPAPMQVRNQRGGDLA